MGYYTLSAFINFVTSIILGSIVLIRNPKNKINYSFSLFAFAVALWSISYFFWQIAVSYNSALFWTRVLMAFAIFIPAFYTHFVLALLGIIKKKKTFLLLTYGIFSAFFVINVTSPYFVSNVKPVLGFHFWPTPGLFFHPFLVLWLAYVIYATYLLYVAQNKETGTKKIQTKYILLGMIIGFIGGSTNYILWYGIPVVPFGNILVSIYVALTAYAIVKHRLFDIRFIVARAIAYIILVLILGAFYSAGIFILGAIFIGNGGNYNNQLITSMILALIMAFSFQPIRAYLEKITDKIFFKNNYNSNELLSRLTKILASTLRLDDLSRKTLSQLFSAMHISKGTFYIFQNNHPPLSISAGFSEKDKYNEHAMKKICANKRIMILDEENNEENKKAMQSLDASIILPLFVGENMHGLLLLGNKRSGDIYFSKDIEVLKIFGPEVSVALENVKAYEEIRRFNITLKEEVDRATKDLQNVNVKLQQVDRLKDEFVSLASHELRTPMTVIKSYLWMMLDKNNVKALSEKQRMYIDRAYASTQRLINLVNDMLNVSRIESGRFTLNMKSLDLGELINTVYAEMLPKAQEQKINFQFARPLQPLPKVSADPERIEQVLINLIGNSLKFTPGKG
ncbi:MAG: Histidine kinase protein, partial [Candidatus Levybacteria bacterium]|nr:Histidine kinase protein [Candidatus Levybacteria bacterium]